MEVIEVYYADLGLSRPTLQSGPSFRVHRVVANRRPIASPQGAAECGEISYNRLRIPVYRLVYPTFKTSWTTSKARIMEPLRTTKAHGQQ
jgi:hypothetical protein